MPTAQMYRLDTPWTDPVNGGIGRPPPENAGVPLGAAVRAFSDPSLLRSYDELCAQIADRPQPGTARYRRGWPDEDRCSQDYLQAHQKSVDEARDTAWGAVLDDLRRRLQDGELTAGTDAQRTHAPR